MGEGSSRRGGGGGGVLKGWGGGGWRDGGGGLAGAPLLPGCPCGPRRKRAEKLLSLNLLGAKGADWLSASNIGRGGGGGNPPPSSDGVRPF